MGGQAFYDRSDRSDPTDPTDPTDPQNAWSPAGGPGMRRAARRASMNLPSSFFAIMVLSGEHENRSKKELVVKMKEDLKAVFLDTLKTEWYPSLRALGFKGRGNDFVRVGDAMVNCINLQIRSDGSSCCANLGLHPRGLPSPSGKTIHETDMQPVDCELTRRLTPGGQTDHWWSFGITVAEAIAAAHDLVAMFPSQGETYFQKYQSIQDLVGNATPDHIAEGNVPVFQDFPITQMRAALLLARLHNSLGNDAAACAFAQYGFDQTTPVKGAGLRKHFREIMRGVGQSDAAKS